MRSAVIAAVIRTAREIAACRTGLPRAPHKKPDEREQKQNPAEDCQKKYENGDFHKFSPLFQVQCQIKNAENQQNKQNRDDRKPFIRRAFGFLPDDFDRSALKAFAFPAQSPRHASLILLLLLFFCGAVGSSETAPPQL
jgi:hypothetical protein